MAERRMFAKKIVSSARFLKMPVSSQLLYFHLCMNADDDGVVEAFTVMKTTSSAEDDLRILVSKGFVVILNEDLVSYIVDWKENNYIRADRKINSIYKDVLVRVVPDVQLLEPKPRSDRQGTDMGQSQDCQGTDMGQSMDGIGKVSIVKDSLGKNSINNRNTNVLLSSENPDKPEFSLEAEVGKADSTSLSTSTTEKKPRAERIKYNDIFESFKTICASLPKHEQAELDDDAKESIKKSFDEGFTYEDFDRAFKMATESRFLSGQKTDWVAQFSWLIQAKNMRKIFNGTYDNYCKPEDDGKAHLKSTICNDPAVFQEMKDKIARGESLF